MLHDLLFTNDAPFSFRLSLSQSLYHSLFLFLSLSLPHYFLLLLHLFDSRSLGLKRIGDLYKRHFEEATEEIKRLEESSSAFKEASSRQIGQLREALQTNGSISSSFLVPFYLVLFERPLL